MVQRSTEKTQSSPNKAVSSFPNEQSKKEEDTYLEFWNEFEMLIKEGARIIDFTYKEDLAKLLRFESTALEPGKLTGLDDYLERMTKDQEEVLFLFGKSRESIEVGPYLEALKARGLRSSVPKRWMSM